MDITQFTLIGNVLSEILGAHRRRGSRCQGLSGIWQGCPLYPFLLIIVMTAIMFDATAKLGVSATEAYIQGTLYDILYADDTLLLGTSADNVSELAAMVERIGADYGLTLHWGKTQAMAIGTDDAILAPGGGEL